MLHAIRTEFRLFTVSYFKYNPSHQIIYPEWARII